MYFFLKSNLYNLIGQVDPVRKWTSVRPFSGKVNVTQKGHYKQNCLWRETKDLSLNYSSLLSFSFFSVSLSFFLFLSLSFFLPVTRALGTGIKLRLPKINSGTFNCFSCEAETTTATVSNLVKDEKRS